MANRKKLASNNPLKVFINCPFDKEYSPFLRALLFTLIYFGFEPLLASQRKDSGELRITKILGMIKQSDISIHDLSRVRAKRKGELLRLNLPFEFGIDWGYRYYNKQKKEFLILEGERYSISKALSDFAGCDPECHDNNEEIMVRIVRNWLVEKSLKKDLPGASVIWDRYNFFYSDLYNKETYSKEDVDSMPISEFISNIQNKLNKVN